MNPLISRCPVGRLGLLAACLLAGGPVWAHPMGNFAICHYTRLQADAGGLRLRCILDLAEIPTVGEKAVLDSDRDGSISAEEKAAYLARRTPELLAGLELFVGDRPIPLREAKGEMHLLAGAGGLDTLKIVLDVQVPRPSEGGSYRVVFRDRNYEARAGWKEMIAVAGPGVALRGSTVPAADRSRELSDYPPDQVPPQDTEARFTVVPGEGLSAAAPSAPATTPANGGTRRDAFTDAIASQELGIGVVLTGLLIAFAFGALHALSPGHGKAMVAAYLVGARGTAWHATLLGLVVTVTHTLGVFALGLVALLASRWVLPERLYPILSAVSGLLICAVGARLLYFRVRRLWRGARPSTAGAVHHHPMPEGPVTARALLALGVSGGLIPCPSALVVLLAAVALQRIAYGMLLISAFSLGLAAVLVAIGVLVVYARQWLDRFSVSAAVLRRVPVASAAVITLIGAALVVRAFGEATF